MLARPVASSIHLRGCPRPCGPCVRARLTSRRGQRREVSLASLIVFLLLCCLSGCQRISPPSLTSRPPREHIEAALPHLLEQVARVRVYGPAKENRVLGPQHGTSRPTVGEALRVAMASCVRFYCTPDEERVLQRVKTASGTILDFEPPQEVPTSSPLPGWFGPLRGYEEMGQVERLYLIPEQGRWTEVIARGASGDWSCWKSNWRIEPSSPLRIGSR